MTALISLRRQLRRQVASFTSSISRYMTYSTKNVVETDACGVPLRPTWSVNELLATYSSADITPTMITRLHELSALKPPQEGTPQYKAAKESLQEMVRLVEAVRSVDTAGVTVTGRGEREDADRNATYPEGSGMEGRELLKNASRVDEDYYVVARTRGRSTSGDRQAISDE